MEFVSRIAKRVTVLHLGKILADGTMEEIHNNKTVQDVYLGH
jgi:urea transport system ATP-binding protein